MWTYAGDFSGRALGLCLGPCGKAAQDGWESMLTRANRSSHDSQEATERRGQCSTMSLRDQESAE